MANNEFAINIRIDGKDATKDAAKIRAAIEEQIAAITVHGEVDIAGLELASKHMASLRKDAGSLGRAIASSLSGQWDVLEGQLSKLQSKVTGLVHAGQGTDIAADMLDGMPELEEALTKQDKKALDLTLKLQELKDRVKGLNQRFGELAALRVQPLGGGELRSMSEMFKGFDERYTRRKVAKLRKSVEAELAPLQAEIDKAEKEARAAAQKAMAPLRERAEALKAELEELNRNKPEGYSSLRGAMTDEARAWEENVAALKKAYLEANDELMAARADALTGDVQELKTQLMFRRRELEGPMKDDLAFWREWGMDSVKEAADALRSYGQSEAAAALEEMENIASERTRLEAQMKRAFGGLAKGSEVELPENAEGTMVDFISAERALGGVVETTTDNLHGQYLEFGKLIKRIDEARMAMDGMSEAERYAAQKMTTRSKSEIRDVYKQTKGQGVEVLAAGEAGVLADLSRGIAGLRKAMEAELSDDSIADAAEDAAKDTVGVWEWVKDKLVGHSVIPEMVAAINKYLDMIGEDREAQGKAQVELAKAEAQERKELAKRETAELREQIKARERAAKEAEQLARLEGEAKQRASAVGVSWEQVQAELQNADVDLNMIIGSLRRLENEQRQVNAQADKLDDEYADAKNGVDRFARALNDAREETQGLGLLANDLQDISQALTMRGAAITGGLTVAARDFVNLRKEADNASRALGLNREMSAAMAQGIVELSAELAVLDPEATAQGVTGWATATGQLVQNQEDLNALLSQTAPVQQLAALGQADIGTVTDSTTAAINQFSLSLDDTTRVVSIFNKVSDDTLAEIPHVAEAFKYVGTDAAGLGESIEDVGAQLSILADNAIRGSQAGTSLASAYKNMATPVPNAADELERLFGVQQPFFDQEGNWIGMARAVDMFAAATADMTDEQKRASLEAIFEVDAMRAMLPLIRAQNEAREEGLNILSEKSADLGETALDVWDKKVQDWEESDVYRVQQAELRWKAFWLTIGQQGLDLALPYLEKGADLLEEFNRYIDANPWATQVTAALGGGALTIGGILAAITVLTKTVTSVRAAFTAFEAMLKKQPSAEQQFQNTIVSAAERFSQIVQQAATESAQIEKTGAAEENQIEQAGAVEEAAIEKSSAMNVAGFLGRAMGALAVAGMGSQALTGQSMAGWFTTAEGEAAGAQRVAGLAGLSDEELKTELSTLTEQIAALRDVVGPDTGMFTFLQKDYWEGVLGSGEQGQVIQDMMGGKALSATAMVDKLAELEAARDGILVALDDVDDYDRKFLELARAESNAADVTATHTAALYDYVQTATDVVALTDEEIKAAELYVELLQAQEEATQDFNKEMADLADSLQADLADIEKRRQEMTKETESFNASQVEAERKYQEQQARAAEEHNKRMRRMQEDHESRVDDLIASRDAYGLIKERESYAREKSRAEEDFQAQQGQREQDFQREQEQRRAQFELRMEEQRAQLETERQERLVAYEQEKLELQQQHAEDMQRLEQEYFEKINAELGYYQQSQEQQRQYQAAMLQDAKRWMEGQRGLWDAYMASLPSPSALARATTSGNSQARFDEYLRGSQGYASGGYVSTTGPAYLHAGEFVLNPTATRQAESLTGTLTQDSLTASLVASQRGARQGMNVNIPIQASFSGMRAADMAAVRQELGVLKNEIYSTLVEVFE